MKKILTLFIILCISFSSVYADVNNESILKEAILDTGTLILNHTSDNFDKFSEINEWAVIPLSKSQLDLPQTYYQKYFDNMKKHLSDVSGILHKRKYTEYSRVILALGSIGANPKDINGYDLTKPLCDFNITIKQGINGAIWALIALDSINFPDTQINISKELYLEHILKNQLSNGGWNLSDNLGESNPDITAMALCAIAGYSERDDVKYAINNALNHLSNIQNSDGGFSSWSEANSESCAQVLIALSTLGISVDDPRFVKGGKTVLDNLLTFYEKGNGFYHMSGDKKTNFMSTEQCFGALVAYERFLSGKSAIYKASNDTISINVPNIQRENVTFDDILNHSKKSEIETLARRNIVNGKSEKLFCPDSSITRAEFTAILVRALGLNAVSSVNNFSDISDKAWYFNYIKTAYSLGIINGISESEFSPDDDVTLRDALTIIKRCFFLCGYTEEYSYNTNLFPSESISRATACEMIYNLLEKGGLL